MSLVLMLPGILLVTLFSPFLISSRAQTTTGIVSVFISNILLTSISKSLYLDNSLYEFVLRRYLQKELLCQWACTFLLSCPRTTMSGLLAFISLAPTGISLEETSSWVAPAYIFWNTYSWNMQSVNCKKNLENEEPHGIVGNDDFLIVHARK